MAKSFLNALVNAQIAGATTGQITGPSVVSALLGSSAQPASGLGSPAGINGLLGGALSPLPGTGSGGWAMPTTTAGFVGPVQSPVCTWVSGRLSGNFGGQAPAPMGATANPSPLGAQISSSGGGPMGLLGGNATFTPNVGGVLFDRCAEVLTNIGEIVGAYWDEAQGSLVILGKSGADAGAMPLRLPTMDRDLLTVALRAAIAGDSIGVSIDPPAHLKGRPEQVGDGTDLWVSYLGGTEGTLCGAILFEADRLLKCLSNGVHNETRKELRAHVPGYRPLVEMIRPDAPDAGNWHRFWFVIDKVVLCRDAATDTLIFKDVRLQVLSEVECGGPSGSTVDSNDKAFTEHLTEYYDEYAKEFPVLGRLKELAKIAAIAKYIARKNISLDLESIFTSHPQSVTTPTTTKAIKVVSPNVKVTANGSSRFTQTVAICGGVNLDPPPLRIDEDKSGVASQFRAAALDARPPHSADSWTFKVGADTLQAHTLPLGIRSKPTCAAFDDYESTANRFLCIRRDYNPALAVGDFGPGWKLHVPCSLTPWHFGGKRREVLTPEEVKDSGAPLSLVFHDHVPGVSALYLPVDGDAKTPPSKFGRVISFKPMDYSAPPVGAGNRQQGAFSWNPDDVIIRAGAGYTLERRGSRFEFDSTGRLTVIRDRNSGKAVYHVHNATGLAALRDDTGLALRIQRDPLNRVTGVFGADCKLEYRYDSEGLLTSVNAHGAMRHHHGYDAQRRLSEARNASGAVPWRTVYDDSGHSLPDGTVTTATEAAGFLRRVLQGGRVISSMDESGRIAILNYRPDGSLLSLVIRRPGDKEWVFVYDSLGTLVSAKSPKSDRVARLSHGNVSGELTPSGLDRSGNSPGQSADAKVIGAHRGGANGGGSTICIEARKFARFVASLRISDQSSERSSNYWWKPRFLRGLRTSIIKSDSPYIASVETPAGRVQYELDERSLVLTVRMCSE